MPSPIVLVTQPEFDRAPSVFASAPGLTCVAGPPAEAAFAKAVQDTGARHVVLGSVRYESALYKALRRGAVVARFGVGHDGVDKLQASAAGLLCTNTPGVLD